MLQTNLSCFPAQMTVYNPAADRSVSIENKVAPANFPCSKTEQLLQLFEEITGWKSTFTESIASLKHRRLCNQTSEPSGTFSIIDMSVSWPSCKPTGHRGKCDQFIELFDQLVGELHQSRTELRKSKSALVALDPTAEIDDDDLVDSFIPKFADTNKTSVDLVVASRDYMADQGDDDDGFVVSQPLSNSSVSPVTPPFDGWALGGSTGIVGNYYLDWTVDQEEQISICAGEIDNVTGNDQESVIQIDPLTNEFRIAPAMTGSGLQSIQPFYLWDSKTLSLVPLNGSEGWQLLKSHQAIVATTNDSIAAIDCWDSALDANNCRSDAQKTDSIWSNQDLSKDVSDAPIQRKSMLADQLADVLNRVLASSDPLLVLQLS